MSDDPLAGWDPPLDSDSENEHEGEELDDDDVWRTCVWRNFYAFCADEPPIRQLPSSNEKVAAEVAAAATAAAATAQAAAVAAVARQCKVQTLRKSISCCTHPTLSCLTHLTRPHAGIVKAVKDIDESRAARSIASRLVHRDAQQ